MNPAPSPPDLVEWSASGRPIPGERESGDACMVAAYPGGVLLGLVDGLGHGPEAAVASRTAIETLQQHAGEPAIALVDRCHAQLRRTRGAVLSLVTIEAATGLMTWIGVGNVEGLLYRAAPGERPDAIVPRAGVVGYRLPALRAATLPIAVGDVLVLASDGVGHGFGQTLALDEPAERLADHILDHYATDADDALVLVARYRGPPS